MLCSISHRNQIELVKPNFEFEPLLQPPRRDKSRAAPSLSKTGPLSSARPWGFREQSHKESEGGQLRGQSICGLEASRPKYGLWVPEKNQDTLKLNTEAMAYVIIWQYEYATPGSPVEPNDVVDRGRTD